MLYPSSYLQCQGGMVANGGNGGNEGGAGTRVLMDLKYMEVIGVTVVNLGGKIFPPGDENRPRENNLGERSGYLRYQGQTKYTESIGSTIKTFC